MMTCALEEHDAVEPVAVEPNGLARYIPLAVWLVAIVALAWIPLKIISYGYLPPDDALRHTAKAVTQRDWNDILVLRPDFQTDHNPGWHWVLGQIHRATGLGTDGLVVVSVLGLYLLTVLAPIAFVRRPEAWLAALLVSTLTFPAFIGRVLLGRPFSMTIAVTLAVLLLWRRSDRSKPSALLLAGTTAMLAVCAWVHGSWYLFGIVVLAFALTGQWRSALWLGGCWLTGSFLGALLTGHPLLFLLNALRIAANCFSGNPLQRMLVLEFWPSDGNALAIFAVLAMVLWRYNLGGWSWQRLNSPVFMLAILGWILGLRVNRFYWDWAAPALVLWIALEFSEHFKRLLPAGALQRLGVATALSASLVFAVTADSGSRWTNALGIEFLSREDPEMAPWLPEDGAILYSADMGIFYQTFFKNPNARWRYMLGFESTFMPPEDLNIYRNIQRNFGSYKSYQPWVKKMQPGDRLAIRSAASSAPDIPGLEWHYTAREIWLGRKPKASTTDASQPVADGLADGF
jgi:hypothetical protein